MEELSFKVVRVEFKKKQYIALEYMNELDLPLHFIFKDKGIMRGWYCVEYKRKVRRQFAKMLDEAFQKICEVVV